MRALALSATLLAITLPGCARRAQPGNRDWSTIIRIGNLHDVCVIGDTAFIEFARRGEEFLVRWDTSEPDQPYIVLLDDEGNLEVPEERCVLSAEQRLLVRQALLKWQSDCSWALAVIDDEMSALEDSLRH